LQPVVGEEQSRGDAIEGQGLSKKDVIHPIGAFDLNFQTRVLAAAKLI
jgi:hypothetical protein